MTANPLLIAQEILEATAEDSDHNHRRAARSLLAFWPSYDGDDFKSGLRDALTDLRHLCDVMGLSFGDLDREGHRLYLIELDECGIAVASDLAAAITEHLT